jgi:hypothetical protein
MMMTRQALVVGALFDFAGYLTARDGDLTVGSKHDAVPMVEALTEFMGARGLRNRSDDAAVCTWQSDVSDDSEFRKKLAETVNFCGMDEASDTPDFLVADLLADCLLAYANMVNRRDRGAAGQMPTMTLD